MKWSLTVAQILEWLENPPSRGTFPGKISGLADLRTAGPGELTFLTGGRYARYLPESGASVIIVPDDQEGEPPKGQVWILVPDPSLALARVCGILEKELLPKPEAGIHPTAIVDSAAQVDPTATVGPFCIVAADAVIGKDVFLESHVRIDRRARIGDGSWLHHGVYIGWDCEIGSDCRLFPGAVVGADGFGFHSDKGGHQRLAQIGKVVVGDHVEIGANTCIDRARFTETRIGEGTKIDNLVQVGHNVQIGRHCIICAHVGIAGSAEIGDFSVFAGQVGINGHIRIGDGVTATGQTGITKDIPAGTVLSGTPGRPHREELKQLALLKKLPEISLRLKALEQGEPENRA